MNWKEAVVVVFASCLTFIQYNWSLDRDFNPEPS
jgi:hypothetical protein